MTTDELGKGIKFLKAFYTRWEFDVTNTFALQVWFKSLQKLSFEQFQDIVQTYCMNNQYPPNSPYDLLNLIPKYPSVEEATQIIRDIAERNTTQEFFLKELYKVSPGLYTFARMIDPYAEKDSFGNKCLGYILKRFKRNYQEYLNNIKIAYIGNQLVQNNNLLLGEKNEVKRLA